MKKTFRYRFSTVVLFLLAISMLVTGCGKESSMERKKANGKVQVVASFYMMYDLAKKNRRRSGGSEEPCSGRNRTT